MSSAERDDASRPRRVTAVLAAIAAIAVGVVGVLLATRDGRGAEPSPSASQVDGGGSRTAPGTRTQPPTVTAPATTTAPPDDGKGAFAAGFEDGWEPFDDLQHEDDRPAADSFALVDSPRRQGGHAARFTVQQGYSRFGHNEDTALVWSSGEQPGDDYWYTWSTLFPADWQAPYRWGIFAEWHAKLATSPIISFNARGDDAELNIHSGRTDEEANRFEVSRDVPLLTTLSKGRWNDFALHVRWARDATGSIEVYHRVEGESVMRRLVHVGGIPTFQVTDDGRGLGTYVLFGLYRGSFCPPPTTLGCVGADGVQAPNVLYHDGFARATSFAAAARHSFPGATPSLATGGRDGADGGAPIALPRHRALRAGRILDRRCGECAVAARANGARATILGPGDDEDTAVVSYLVRQRRSVVVRSRVRVTPTRRLAGNLVVLQLRRRTGPVLVEVYVSPADGRLYAFSPDGALVDGGFNAPVEQRAARASSAPEVRVRLTSGDVRIEAGGDELRIGGVHGPEAGDELVARLGADHYDGSTRGGVTVVLDDVVVGSR